MKFTLSGKHVDLGESLSSHIQEKIKGLVARYVDDVIEADVVFEKDHHLFRTDITLHVSHNFVVRGSGSDSDPYRCADLALEKIENRLKRYRDRLRDRHRKDPASDVSALHYVVSSEAEDSGQDTPLVIAEMNSTIPVLSVSEAVMQMDLAQHVVLMFKNVNNGNFNVIYRREDGHIGWIDPGQKA